MCFMCLVRGRGNGRSLLKPLHVDRPFFRLLTITSHPAMGVTMALTGLLDQHRSIITNSLFVGFADWDDLLERVRTEEQSRTLPCFYEEQVWTFLASCGYAVAGEAGVKGLIEVMVGPGWRTPHDPKIWFEVLPIPPRVREGCSHVDLAVGDIAIRNDAPGSGIRLAPSDGSWACFSECKWYRDISIDVVNDVERNQLTRVIENLLCFQHYEGPFRHYVDRPAFTLITPGCFVLDQDPPKPLSRLYQYLFREYRHQGETAVLQDIHGFKLEKRNEDRWKYPTDQRITENAKNLTLRWVTYDDLFDRLPASPLQQAMKSFWQQHGGYQGRPS